MSYTPTTWIEKATQVGPTNLNKLENGLQAAAAIADTANALGAAALPVTIFDAKGDVLVASAADTPARLAVGSNGQVLTADSAQATGLRWRDRTTYGTSPPASPQDGDEWIYPADVANGVMWRFRYNAGSGSIYKWEFVGGPSLHTAIVGAITTSSTTDVDLTSGPTLTVPRAGDYIIDAEVWAQNSSGYTSAYTPQAKVTFSTSGAGYVISVVIVAAASGGGRAHWSQIRTSFVAGETAKIQVRVNNAVPTIFNDGMLSLCPVRVS